MGVFWGRMFRKKKNKGLLVSGVGEVSQKSFFLGSTYDSFLPRPLVPKVEPEKKIRLIKMNDLGSILS